MREAIIIFTAFASFFLIPGKASCLNFKVENGIQVLLNDEILTRYLGLFIQGKDYPSRDMGPGSKNVMLTECTMRISVMRVFNEIIDKTLLSLTVRSLSNNIVVNFNSLRVSSAFLYLIEGLGGTDPSCTGWVSDPDGAFFSFEGTPQGSPLYFSATPTTSGDIRVNVFGSSDIGLLSGDVYNLINGAHYPIDLGQFEPYRPVIERTVKEIISVLLSQYFASSLTDPIQEGLTNIIDTKNKFREGDFYFDYDAKSISFSGGIVRINYSSTITSPVDFPLCGSFPSNADDELPPYIFPSQFNFSIGFSGKYINDIIILSSFTGKMCGWIEAKGIQFYGVFPELFKTFYSYSTNFYDKLHIYYSYPLFVDFEGGTGQVPGYVNFLSFPVSLVYYQPWRSSTVFSGNFDIRIPLRLKGNTTNQIIYQMDAYKSDLLFMELYENTLHVPEGKITLFLKNYAIPLILRDFYSGTLSPSTFKRGGGTLSPFRFYSNYTDWFSGNSPSFSVDLIMEGEFPEDSQKPFVQFTSLPPYENNQNEINIVFTGTDNLTPASQIHFTWRLMDASGNLYPWSPERWEDRDGGEAYLIPLSYVPEGPLTVEVKAKDLSLVWSDPLFSSFIVDTISPVPYITSGPLSFTKPGTFHFEFKAEDFFHEPSAISFSYKIDNENWSPFQYIRNTDIYLDQYGNHVFYLRGKDPAGNIGEPITWPFYIDTKAPETIILKSPPRYTMGFKECFSYTATDDFQKDDFEFYYRLDSNSFSGPHKLTSTCFENISEGDHFFEVYAVDKAGNVDLTPAFAPFTVDRVPPELRIERLYPSYSEDPEDDIYGEYIIRFYLEAHDNVTPENQIELLFSVNDGYPSKVTPLVEYNHLKNCRVDDQYTFLFKAIDRAGNITTKSLTIYIDCRKVIIFGGKGCASVSGNNGFVNFIFPCISVLILWIIKKLKI